EDRRRDPGHRQGRSALSQQRWVDDEPGGVQRRPRDHHVGQEDRPTAPGLVGVGPAHQRGPYGHAADHGPTQGGALELSEGVGGQIDHVRQSTDAEHRDRAPERALHTPADDPATTAPRFSIPTGEGPMDQTRAGIRPPAMTISTWRGESRCRVAMVVWRVSLTTVISEPARRAVAGSSMWSR